MTAINTAINGFDMARALLDRTSLVLSEGHVSPEVITAREMAQVQMEAQNKILKEALAAEAQILDLLV